MTLNKRNLVPVFSLACIFLAGCASTSPKFTRVAPRPVPKPVAPEPAPSPKDKSLALKQENTILRNTPSSYSAAERHQARPPASLINLFGELEGDGPARSTLEGRGNLSQISFALEGSCFDPAIDPSGRWIAFASTMHSPSSDIYIKAVEGTTVTQVTTSTADDVMPTFSPDGKRLAFASNRQGRWDIYVTSISGGPPVQVTNDTDHEIHPTWSPDGRFIAYSRYGSQSGRWEIWVTEVENPGVKHFLEYGMFPKWSPDVTSNKILFQRPRQRGSRLHGIWTIDFVNGEALHPTEIISAANAAVINPSWSPDGRRIVFATVIDPDATAAPTVAQSDIWVVNVDGSGRVRLTDGQFANYQPVWASDGRVYFVSNRSGLDNIWAVGADRVLALTQPEKSGFAGVDAERDSR